MINQPKPELEDKDEHGIIHTRITLYTMSIPVNSEKKLRIFCNKFHPVEMRYDSMRQHFTVIFDNEENYTQCRLNIKTVLEEKL